METILIVIQLLVSVALVIVVMLQKSEGGALGMGGGGSGLGGLFSPRGAADTLTRLTTVLAIIFFLSSLGLTLVALHQKPASSSLLDSGSNTAAPATPASNQAPKPGNPLAPKVPTPQ
jgi:preprotein translocase subunit SecG